MTIVTFVADNPGTFVGSDACRFGGEEFEAGNLLLEAAFAFGGISPSINERRTT